MCAARRDAQSRRRGAAHAGGCTESGLECPLVPQGLSLWPSLSLPCCPHPRMGPGSEPRGEPGSVGQHLPAGRSRSAEPAPARSRAPTCPRAHAWAHTPQALLCPQHPSMCTSLMGPHEVRRSRLHVPGEKDHPLEGACSVGLWVCAAPPGGSGGGPAAVQGGLWQTVWGSVVTGLESLAGSSGSSLTTNPAESLRHPGPCLRAPRSGLGQRPDGS